MQLKNLLQEDDAVSPVIGVILMVAITVILAAVIASFVLGLGGNTQQNPQASFSWDYEEHDNGTNNVDDGVVTISHDSGDSIVASELYVRGSGFSTKSDINTNSSGFTGPINITDSSNNTWPDSQASGEEGNNDAVVSGDTVNVAVQSDFDLDLVWQPAEGDTSATLSEETGPDA